MAGASVSTSPQRPEEDLDYKLRRLEAAMNENLSVGIFWSAASQELLTSQMKKLHKDLRMELDNVRNNYVEYEQKSAELFRRLQHDRRMSQRRYQVVREQRTAITDLKERIRVKNYLETKLTNSLIFAFIVATVVCTFLHTV